MSGFTSRGFELTRTKAMHWHRGRTCCKSLSDIARTHLVPAGFDWQFGVGGNFLIVNGPGLSLAEEDATALYEAVSGRESMW